MEDINNHELPSSPENQEAVDVLVLTQKEWGAFTSFPIVDDVMDALGLVDDSEQEWEKEAQVRGHQEYIDNVKKAAEFCGQRGITTRLGVEAVLKTARVDKV